MKTISTVIIILTLSFMPKIDAYAFVKPMQASTPAWWDFKGKKEAKEKAERLAREKLRKELEEKKRIAEAKKKAAEERTYSSQKLKEYVSYSIEGTRSHYGTKHYSGYYYTNSGDSNVYYEKAFDTSILTGSSVAIKMKNNLEHRDVKVEGIVSFKTEKGYESNDSFRYKSCLFCYSVNVDSQDHKFSFNLAAGEVREFNIGADKTTYGLGNPISAPINEATVRISSLTVK